MEALIIEQNIVSLLSSKLQEVFYMYMSLKNDAISKDKKKTQKNQKCL